MRESHTDLASQPLLADDEQPLILDRLGVTTDEYYRTAVAANRGLVDQTEQRALRDATVAIAGLGGLGGACMTTLVRMGIGRFRIADLDRFSISNVHRQEGATASTVGLPKVETMASMARDLHPGVHVTGFGDGVTEGNVDAFLDGVDVVVDAIDFFCLPARRLLHQRARVLGKPVIVSIPIGFGASLQVFAPHGMSLDDYFALRDDQSPFEAMLRFLVGVVPTTFHAKYMDMTQGSVRERKSIGIASAVRLCAGVVGAEALALLLRRGDVRFAPSYAVFDPYAKRYERGKIRWGNRGPLQRLRVAAARKRFAPQRDAFNELWTARG